MDSKLLPVGLCPYAKSVDINGSGDIIEVQVTPPPEMTTPLMFTVVPYVSRGSYDYGPVNFLPWRVTDGQPSYIKTACVDSNSYVERLYKVSVTSVSSDGLTCTLDVNADDPMFNDAYVYIFGLGSIPLPS